MHPNLLRQLQEEVNLSNDLPGLIQNLSALLSMARKRNQERLRDIHHAEVAMKIQELKKLRPQSLLYCRCTGPLLGESVRKIKDGKRIWWWRGLVSSGGFLMNFFSLLLLILLLLS